MSNDNQLRRAHQLSAQATALVAPVDANVATLNRGLAAYQEAADLYDAASKVATDATRNTLQMLTIQHRKLAKELERRINYVQSPPSPVSPTYSKPASPFVSSDAPRRASLEPTTTSPRPQLVGRHSGSSVGLAAGRGGVLGGAGLTIHATAARSVPPFALRPVPETGGSTSNNPPPPAPFRTPGSPRSPLYSSSSSSEPPDESYLLPGAVPDASDPFSRFWGRLENMLEEISFPKALTSLPFSDSTLPPAGSAGQQQQPAKQRQARGKASPRSKERALSPSESFYVVPPHRENGGGPAPPARKSAALVAKTPEELALENESLRASLDALAAHAHSLELACRAQKAQAAERDKLVRSVVSDVRREAHKVQEVQRSQMLASAMPVQRAETGAQKAHIAALNKRVAELEEEVTHLHDDNRKLNMQLDKFKEKWEKLKAKKEAKVAAAKARSSRSPDQPG